MARRVLKSGSFKPSPVFARVPEESDMRSAFSSSQLHRSKLGGDARFLLLPLVLACSGGDDPGDSTTIEPPRAAPLDGAQKAELDDYIGDALGRYGVPGAAVAVVRGRDVVYQGSFGVRSMSDAQPVTPNTRFAIGSVAKSMTSMLAATLVDDGKLGWETRVTDIMPAFGLSDPESTAQIRVRDLLNGTSGVPRFDTPFFVRTFSPTELIGLIRTIPTVAPPGEVFGYSNAMVSAGGYLTALADGAAYDDAALTATYHRLIQERVLSPIGMTDTTFDVDVALAEENHAWPHSYDGAPGAVVPTAVDAEKFITSVMPAGGAWSTLRDMAAYASTQLSGVAPNGTRLVSWQNLEETHTEAIRNLPAGEWPTADRQGAGYAMGWFTMPDYRGMRALSHDGNTLGFTSEVFLLPDADLAVVVLANRGQANQFYGAVEQYAVETVLSLEHRSDELQLSAAEALDNWIEDLSAASVPVAPEDALPHLGHYEHHARVDFTGQGLVLLTDFGVVPLAAYADSGLFVRTGELTGMTVAAFDSDSGPSQLTLGIPGGDGLSQPFVLRRLGE
jgi:CubicO group peptidase (beta-lactamase class C family)